MDQQAAAMTQMAQASLSNAKALERVAEASHLQVSLHVYSAEDHYITLRCHIINRHEPSALEEVDYRL